MSFKPVLSPEVAKALASNQPVVALESTIISHGMPFPQNLKMAREVEQIIRDLGATPATVGILQGQVCAGMTDEQLEKFAKAGLKTRKVSRRDLASVVANREDGATTVAATMIVAHMAGIKVFVTGGIGGVHRGAEETWDVSSDLTELGSTPVAVVCAGAKSILDIPKTLEFLETQGVPVVGLRTKYFPAFFTPSSGLPAPLSLESENEVAKLIAAQRKLGLKNGIVVGNPIPGKLAAEVEKVETATQQAVQESVEKKIVGRDATPFLLKRINELTGGESLRANIELVKNNAVVGAKIAKHLATLQPTAANMSSAGMGSRNARGTLAVIGGAVLDSVARPGDEKEFGKALGTSVPGKLMQSAGGVGRNLADCIARLAGEGNQNKSWCFQSVVGDDSAALVVQEGCGHLPTNLTVVQGQRTATYTAMLDQTGDLLTAVADMDVFENWPVSDAVALAKWCELLLVDGNVPVSVLGEASRNGTETWFEPVSIAKAYRSIPALKARKVALVKPNLDELLAILTGLAGKPANSAPKPPKTLKKNLANKIFGLREIKAAIPKLVKPLLGGSRPLVQHLLVSCGKLGAVLCTRECGDSPQSSETDRSLQHATTYRYNNVARGVQGVPSLQVQREEWPASDDGIYFSYFSVPPQENVVNCHGAGDNLFAATAWAYRFQNLPLRDAVLRGLAAAHLALFSKNAVAGELDPSRVIPTPAARI